MSLETVAGALLGVLVFCGLAFGERIVDRLASLDSSSDLYRPNEHN